MSLYAVECFANDNLTITSNLFLDNTAAWTVASQVVTLDFLEIFQTVANTNTNIGVLTTFLNPITTNNIIIANSNNFTLTILANNFQTDSFMTGAINPAERTLIIQTVFNSDAGASFHGNNIYLRIKNAQN